MGLSSQLSPTSIAEIVRVRGPFFLSFVGLGALIFGGVMFIRHPHMFLFRDEAGVERKSSCNIVWRIFLWIVCTSIPMLWLISIIELQSRGSFGLGARMVASYIFFAWIAAMGILSPVFFARD